MKKILIILIAVIALALIGTGVYLTISTTPDTEEKEETPKEEEPGSVDPETATKDFPSIKTQDNKITLSNTTVYYRDEVSAFEVEVTSTEAMAELYLLIEFDLETEKHLRAIYLTNVNANEKMKTQIQTDKDLTKAKSWTVKQATRDEVIAAGFEIATSMKGENNEE